MLVDADRRIRGGVDPPGDRDLDLSERDLVGDEDRRLETGPASLLDVVRGSLGRELRAEDGLAREVEVAAVLEDGSGRYLAEQLALERELADERVERRRQHVLVRCPRAGAVLPSERDPDAAAHCHPPGGV